MSLPYTYQVCLVVLSLLITGHDHRKKDDKLILSPVELIDLVRKEQKTNMRPGRVPKHFGFPAQTTANNGLEVEDTTECEDSRTLKSRKVWSRWGKWGPCSVTCGGGTVARRRVCVAGRCARGELEEQRRPCERAPCRVADHLPDDNREE